VATTTRWVLDTSIAAAWFFPDDHQHTRALAVRQALRDDPRAFVVPHLFFSELIHVLSRKWRDAKRATSAVDLVLRFGIRTLPLSADAWRSAAEWACRAIGGYDATFVALAQDLDARWLTADEGAARAVGELAVTLEDYA
jgi:predicted nucleic acid-binding protein